MDTNQILQQVILYAIPVVVPFVCAWLVAKIRTEWAVVKDRYPSVTDALDTGAKLAVDAAEQLATQPGFQAEWNTKKDYALQVVQAYLDAHGIKLDATLIEAAIESSVKAMNEAGTNITVPPNTSMGMTSK